MGTSSYRTVLTKDDINALPVVAYGGPITVVDAEEQLDAALDLLEGETVIGLDTETRPCFEKGKPPFPTALLQLCGERAAVLIRVRSVPMSDRLRSLLSDPNVLKAGVGIEEDMRLLRRDIEFVANGLVDLSKVAKAAGVETLSLRALAANFLSGRISKSAQCSNWERPELSPQQIVYGATDAWVGREVYLRMRTMPEFVFTPISVTDDRPSADAKRRPRRRRRLKPAVS